MIPLSRCIELLDYTEKLSIEQKKSIIFYLKRLRDDVQRPKRQKENYSKNAVGIVSLSKYEPKL